MSGLRLLHSPSVSGHHCKSSAAELEDHSPSPEGGAGSTVEEECPATPSRSESHREGLLTLDPSSHTTQNTLSFPQLHT